jgi:cytoskeletal protein RodZ
MIDITVSNKSTVETQQARQNRRDAQKSSDRFSSLLDSHTRQQSESDDVVRRADRAQTTKERETEALHPHSAVHDALSGVAASEAPVARVEVDEASAPAANTPAQVEKLAEELGHQIQLHRVSGNAHGIDITFQSRSLAGLQVQIREEKGKLAIRFLAPSASTSQLLSRHSQSLRDSLADRGLRIQNIVIANGHAPAASPGGRSAEG